MDLSHLEKELHDYLYAMSTEGRLTRVGLKATSEMAVVQAKYAPLFAKENVAELAARLATASGDERETVKRFHAFLLDGYLYAKLAGRSDELLTELLAAKTTLNGEEIGYFELQPRWVTEPDFAKRNALYAAFTKLNAGVLPQQQALLTDELTMLRDEFAAPRYVDFIAARKEFSYEPFRQKIHAAAARLQPLYRRKMNERTQALSGRPMEGLSPAQANYANQLGEYNDVFSADRLLPTVDQALTALGVPLSGYPNIHVDAENRPKKNPRAFCTCASVPDEIHLVIKPVGGIYDYGAFLHEAGHCLHFGSTDPALPFAYRELQTSHALTEIYSYQLEHLTYEPRWIATMMGVEAEKAREIAAAHRLTNLFMFIRYAAKLEYELAFFDDPLNWGRGADLYEKTLTEATGFRYPAENFLYDFDDGLYSADYLRAWVTQAQLTEYLREEFGEDWFADRRTGDFLRELWKEGEKPSNEDIARRIGATPHDTGALERFFGELLE